MIQAKWRKIEYDLNFHSRQPKKFVFWRPTYAKYAPETWLVKTAAYLW